MSALLDRYLPASERRTALWLILGGAAVVWAASEVTAAVWSRYPETEGGTGLYAVQIFAAFAVVTLLVAVLIRVARAPAALALYVALGALLDSAVRVLGIPGDMFAATGFRVALEGGANDVLTGGAVSVLILLAVSLGAVAGAWVASTVSLARIRDEGFSGDETDDGVGLKRKPPSRGWSFLGWTGRPLAGDALLAGAFVVVGIIPSLAGVGFNLLMLPVMGGLDWESAFLITSAGSLVVLVVAWFFSARLVTLRTGVLSEWMVPVGGLLMAVVLAVQLAAQSWPIEELITTMGFNLITAILTPLAALLGVVYAMRAKPATLSEPDQQDPGATPPADTAGG